MGIWMKKRPTGDIPTFEVCYKVNQGIGCDTISFSVFWRVSRHWNETIFR